MAAFSPISRSLEFLPEPGTDVRQLFILLHGVGGSPDNLLPLAEAVRAAFPAAAVLIPEGFEPFDGGGTGRQWFSVRGVSEENRPERVAQAMPPLEAYVRQAQARFGLLQSDTALAGFSQGAIMALELVQAHDGMAGRVIAFSGRYAQLPKAAPQYTTLHLLHGADDPVMHVSHIQAAQARLDELHGDATIDIATHVGHELHPALIQRAIVRLQTCVPLRSWEAALGLNQTPPDGATLH
ncbi:esterase [Achromobacter sp. DH1f]|uniref:esterase n=1 Tax=Achromobacter sp. DH1f TaxID=1397275 RepID=UPI00046989C7|nr:esterase [Achromobacter sp. DH1f]